jgi:hypothetical protein
MNGTSLKIYFSPENLPRFCEELQNFQLEKDTLALETGTPVIVKGSQSFKNEKVLSQTIEVLIHCLKEHTPPLLLQDSALALHHVKKQYKLYGFSTTSKKLQNGIDSIKGIGKVIITPNELGNR